MKFEPIKIRLPSGIYSMEFQTASRVLISRKAHRVTFRKMGKLWLYSDTESRAVGDNLTMEFNRWALRHPRLFEAVKKLSARKQS